MGGEVRGDRSAERLAVDDQPADRNASGAQPVVRRLRIAIRSPLVRRAGAAPIAAVVEQQHVGAETAEDGELVEPVADVAGIAVQEEKCSPRVSWDEPRVQAYAVARGQLDVFIREAERGGGPAVVSAGREIHQ